MHSICFVEHRLEMRAARKNYQLQRKFFMKFCQRFSQKKLVKVDQKFSEKSAKILV